jgi:hypothetical protein
MKTFGKTNSMQASSQTGEDNLEVRVVIRNIDDDKECEP